eukprot:TRINITY_DN10546_c0_g1_i1.p1 TRINITY_DN10546_c0_g1~~TRINITY_DN10546_c0_g1_i1.p1  ORF type:complete len:184 (-),score=11.20 TRINITY_DN10546_c0_g1_i1:199-750(-)
MKLLIGAHRATSSVERIIPFYRTRTLKKVFAAHARLKNQYDPNTALTATDAFIDSTIIALGRIIALGCTATSELLHWDATIEPKFDGRFNWILFGAIECVVVGIPLTFLLLGHIAKVSSNITTNELLNYRRFAYIETSTKTCVYNNGFFENWSELFRSYKGEFQRWTDDRRIYFPTSKSSANV